MLVSVKGWLHQNPNGFRPLTLPARGAVWLNRWRGRGVLLDHLARPRLRSHTPLSDSLRARC
jgi:hypothetical protein